jgi:Ca2+-binding RTX toxin-like protein
MAIIIGTPFNDVRNGTALSDLIDGLAGNDLLRGLGGNDRLVGGLGDDSLDGGVGNDWLDGGFGNDFLNGGLGADTMLGGFGNDVYLVDNVGDRVVEAPGAGIDRVVSSLVVTNLLALSPNVENLTLASPSAAITGIGNNLSNQIIGNNNNNNLFGLFGNDSLFGGFGNDLLNGGVGNDHLNGSFGNDALIGGLGADTLIGGFGADRFIFQTTADSPFPAVAFGDRILDFTRAQGDRIDVSAIDANAGLLGNQAFAWGGFDATPATGPATGVMNFAVIGGQTFVRGNVDADAAIEIEFRVSGPGVPGMLAGDFLL